MIPPFLRDWLLTRRIRAARRYADARHPATNSEWFADKSVAYFLEQGKEPRGKYQASHAIDAWSVMMDAVIEKIKEGQA